MNFVPPLLFIFILITLDGYLLNYSKYKTWILLGVASVLLTSMYLTNPTKENHVEQLTNDLAKSNDFKSINRIELQNFCDTLIYVDDYKIFSLTKIDMNKHHKHTTQCTHVNSNYVGIGLFGIVSFFVNPITGKYDLFVIGFAVFYLLCIYLKSDMFFY